MIWSTLPVLHFAGSRSKDRNLAEWDEHCIEINSLAVLLLEEIKKYSLIRVHVINFSSSYLEGMDTTIEIVMLICTYNGVKAVKGKCVNNFGYLVRSKVCISFNSKLPFSKNLATVNLPTSSSVENSPIQIF